MALKICPYESLQDFTQIQFIFSKKKCPDSSNNMDNILMDLASLGDTCSLNVFPFLLQDTGMTILL